MKNIVLRDEVYEMLSKMKGEKESFSDVILRIMQERRSRSLEVLRKYAGSLKESDMMDIVLKERKSFRMREFDIRHFPNSQNFKRQEAFRDVKGF
ncbi:MAG: antitoxin VapB family protein [Thermoproteota archaeon]